MEVYLDGLLRATTKKRLSTFFGKKVHSPDKILATPITMNAATKAARTTDNDGETPEVLKDVGHGMRCSHHQRVLRSRV